MKRLVTGLLLAVATIVLGAGPVLACGGLVAPNGAVNLLRTTTLAAYVDGIEHYVTSFEFAGGGGGKFGSIVPLPAVPAKVSKAGRWTLQRLVEEVRPPEPTALAFESATADSRRSAEVLLETRVSALDITVLKGGGDEVGRWAEDNGFSLPPDAPEVLDFYAGRSPIFMAVRFDLERARAKDLTVGQGIPVHLTIPTDRPWVPLRILGLGRQPGEIVEADVFLLTGSQPSLLPYTAPTGSETGMVLERSEPATELLLTDLAGDRGMDWLPESNMWLSYIRINAPAAALDHDLAIGLAGERPSALDAGLITVPERTPAGEDSTTPLLPWVLAAATAAGVLVAAAKFATDGS
jgi:hypothetical protein